MQFRVVLPEHVKAGQTIQIACPDGTLANVKVPKGVKIGDSFVFEMPVDQLDQPDQLLTKVEPHSTGSDGSSATYPKGFTLKPTSFLDRDIASLHDLCLALSVGLIIGLGIVIGFLGGILYATRNIAVIQTASTLLQSQIDQMPQIQGA